MKKRGLLIFARGVLYLITAAALAICFILLPEIAREEGVGKPHFPYVMIVFLAVVYIVATPFFIALYQAHKLLNYIDKNKAFSLSAVRAFKTIKICAIVCSILIVANLIGWISFIKIIGPGEDVAPFVTIGFVFTFVSTVIAVAATVMQKLIAEAVSLKSENDLIV